MGHTNYWIQHRDFTDDEWKKITKEARRICKAMPLAGGDGTGDPSINGICVAFNGIRENAEDAGTFYLSKQNTDGGDECKTYQEPYDAAVVTMLAKAKRVAPDAISISCDKDLDGKTFKKMI